MHRHPIPLAVRIGVGAVLAVGLIIGFWPLPGPTPMRCVYDGDSGSCETLLYRSPITVAAATLSWGGDVVHVR